MERRLANETKLHVWASLQLGKGLVSLSVNIWGKKSQVSLVFYDERAFRKTLSIASHCSHPFAGKLGELVDCFSSPRPRLSFHSLVWQVVASIFAMDSMRGSTDTGSCSCSWRVEDMIHPIECYVCLYSLSLLSLFTTGTEQ